MENDVRELETSRRNNEARKFYKEIGYIRKEGSLVTANTCIKSKENVLLNEEEKIVGRLREYFNRLLNESLIEIEEKEQDTTGSILDDEIDVDPPGLEEIRRAVKCLKNNKAAGTDNIPAEFYKYVGEEMIKALRILISQIWNEEVMPEEWNTAAIVPIFKKGDRTLCNNYRGIPRMCSIQDTIDNHI
jgi:hypothetical protein